MKTLITLFIFIFSYLLIPAQNNWELVKTGITEDLHDIEFINEQTGFIYSYGTGNIYKTVDTGKTWNIIYITDSIYFEQIQFTDSKNGLICGEKGKILRTVNGGKTWSDISIKSEGGHLLLYGMCFINDSIGYISGAELIDKKYNSKFYKTSDAGKSWELIFPEIKKMILNLYRSNNNLFATGSDFIIKIDLHTHNWNYVFKDTTKQIGQIRDIKLSNDTFGMAVSFKGQVLTTIDSGNSFTFKKITENRLRSIEYIGEKRWIICGDNNKNDDSELYISLDKGKNWKKHGGFPDIHRITSTENTVWIVGKKGFIAKTEKSIHH